MLSCRFCLRWSTCPLVMRRHFNRSHHARRQYLPRRFKVMRGSVRCPHPISVHCAPDATKSALCWCWMKFNAAWVALAIGMHLKLLELYRMFWYWAKHWAVECRWGRLFRGKPIWPLCGNTLNWGTSPLLEAIPWPAPHALPFSRNLSLWTWGLFDHRAISGRLPWQRNLVWSKCGAPGIFWALTSMDLIGLQHWWKLPVKGA